MATHRQIDIRSLELARAVASKIDDDPSLLDKVVAWAQLQEEAAIQEWLKILDRPWEEVKQHLLDPTDEGCRLRQSSPFVGILSPKERWDIYRRSSE